MSRDADPDPDDQWLRIAWELPVARSTALRKNRSTSRNLNPIPSTLPIVASSLADTYIC
jgi:hypothetical protein